MRCELVQNIANRGFCLKCNGPGRHAEREAQEAPQKRVSKASLFVLQFAPNNPKSRGKRHENRYQRRPQNGDSNKRRRIWNSAATLTLGSPNFVIASCTTSNKASRSTSTRVCGARRKSTSRNLRGLKANLNCIGPQIPELSMLLRNASMTSDPQEPYQSAVSSGSVCKQRCRIVPPKRALQALFKGFRTSEDQVFGNAPHLVPE